MLKVVAVSDKKFTAIDRLCHGVERYHDNLDYVVCDVHPKRPDPEQLARFEKEAITADVLDFQYFRTALKLMEIFPWIKDKKTVLTHNNPYSIHEQKWEDFDVVVANNLKMQKDLEEITGRDIPHIPLAVDTDFWTYGLDWKPNKNVIMVANRIEAKKGILEVAVACENLGLNFILVGAISDRAYFDQILSTKVVDFYPEVSDEKLRELYHNSTIHVCNSRDNFESGTLPILEAMLCGVPVLSRSVGHVPDMSNGENIKIMESQPEEVEKIMRYLDDMMNDKKQLEVQRGSAWNTAKNFSHERRAYMYQKLYRSMFPGPPVSVIVPIYDKPEIVRACLNAIAEQDYPNLELIICDDMPKFYEMDDDSMHNTGNEALVDKFARTVSFPVRYINTSQTGYGLARARNEGIIAATGDVLVFIDQRQIPEKDAITKLVDNLVPKTWVFGNKGGKKDFVENFSAIYRRDLIQAGMFCERMDRYGGITQEVRSRTKAQGIRHVYVESAKANPMGKSSNRNRKRADIIHSKNKLFKMDL